MDLIDIAVEQGTTEAYVARPDRREHPGVLLLMDAFGIRPQIAAMADRIAGWGYVVLAPNLFHRSGTVAELMPDVDLRDPDNRGEVIQQAMSRVKALTPDVIGPDVTGYLAALQELPGVASGPVGVTGYCMGGRHALVAACAHPGIAVAGCFHGGGLATEDEDSPHLGLPNARAQFVFGHADGDRSMAPEAIDRLESALDDAGLAYTSAVYPGAPHGYTMADTSSYQEAGAERHYTELRALLSRLGSEDLG